MKRENFPFYSLPLFFLEQHNKYHSHFMGKSKKKKKTLKMEELKLTLIHQSINNQK